MFNDITEVKAKSFVYDEEEMQKGLTAIKKPRVKSIEV